MFTNYLQIKRHALCALCGTEASYAGTARQVEKHLRAAGWQEIELRTPVRVYGGLVCRYCAETFCEEGVFATERDEWREAVEAATGRELR